MQLMKDWMSRPLPSGRKEVVDFVNNIQAKVNAQEGNTLPVSAFTEYVDGTTPSGTAAYEKRGIAVNVPVWNPENCIQCNRCAYVCPHAVIRPVALTEEEAAAAPEGMQDSADDWYAAVQVCYGSFRTTTVPDAVPVQMSARARRVQRLWLWKIWKQAKAEQKYFDYAVELPAKADVVEKFKENTVKGCSVQTAAA